MTKKKRPAGSGGATLVRGHVLSDEAKTRLAAIADLDLSKPDEAAFMQPHFARIQLALGYYNAGRDDLDHPQTAGEYVKDAQRFRKLANALLTELQRSTEWTRVDLEASGFEVSDFQLEIGKLLDALRDMEKRYEGQKRKGNTTNNAIRWVILQLLLVFGRIYFGDQGQRVARGAVAKKSPREIAEERFVRIALKDAEIPIPTNLSTYFYEPWH